MGFFDTKTEHSLPKALQPLVGMLANRATEDAPDFPQRQTPDVDPVTGIAYDKAEGLLKSGPSSAYSTALAEATKTATTPVDVQNMPELKAVMDRVAAYGQQEGNRLQRGNIISGNASWRSSAGRDVLGRSTTETQERMLAAAAPFLQAARTQKQQAINQLAGLDAQGTATTQSNIETGTRVGSILRGIQAARLEAEYQNAYDPINFRYNTQPQIAGVAFGAPYTATSQPSTYEKWVTGLSTAGRMIQGAQDA